MEVYFGSMRHDGVKFGVIVKHLIDFYDFVGDNYLYGGIWIFEEI